MRSKYIIAAIIFLIVAGGLFFGISKFYPKASPKLNIEKEFSEVAGEKNKAAVFEMPETKLKVKSQKSKSLSNTDQNLDKAYIKVPFSPQAPYANWDQPYQDACEEASIVMVHYFLQGKSLSRDQMNTEILNLVAWQNKTYGGHHDLEANQILDLAKRYYGYKNGFIKYNFTIDDIKREISRGNPVILPTAGRMLGNPNFRGAGPLYHCLVIKGFTSKWIITNDPGTRNGFDYVYSYDTILKAAHEWNNGNVTTGRSAMIVLGR